MERVQNIEITKCRLLQNVDSYKILDYDGLGQVKTISGPSDAARIG